jgi:RNA polymerase sigma-70 factor (ECF subfamily)
MDEAYEGYRAYLFAIAYRMLSSAMDAEDLVQETYLRYQAMSPEAQASIVSLKAYLTTILTRLCVNQLQSAHQQREQYIGPWLPEPISTDDAGKEADPEERVEWYESLSLAFLVLLEELQPTERAVFLLREVFDYQYEEIAGFLGKSEVACRQAFSRAKKHIAAGRPRFTPSLQTQREMLSSFLVAVQGGDMNRLMTLLAHDATLSTDGGGKVRGQAMRQIIGRDRVARMVIGTTRLLPEGATNKVASVNGEPAAIIEVGGRVFAVIAVEVIGQEIQAVRVFANPEKLARIYPQVR